MADIPEATRLPVVAVIGSAGPGLASTITKPQHELAFAIGATIAREGCHLLTGGGPGIMAAAGQGFCSISSSLGVSIGVIPAGKPPATYPNPWVHLPIRTHLHGADPTGPDSRNHINIRSARIVIALTGGRGTRAELELAIEHHAAHNRPMVCACLEDTDDIDGLRRGELEAAGVVCFQTAREVAGTLAGRLRSTDASSPL